MKFKKQFYLLFICLWAGITKTTFAQQPATYDYVVSSNGKGNFTTIQEAINAVPDFRKKQTRILLSKHIQRETCSPRQQNKYRTNRRRRSGYFIR